MMYGLHDIETIGRHRYLWLNTEDLEGGLRVFREQGLDGIAISTCRGFHLNNVAFLSQIPKVRAFFAASGTDKVDLQAVSTCSSLETLIVGDGPHRVDMTGLHQLQSLSLHWQPGCVLPEPSCVPRLRHLKLWAFREEAMCSLPSYCLSELALNGAAIRDLRGMNRFPKVSGLSFACCRRLESLRGVEVLGRLRELRFEACRKLKDWELLRCCKGLRVLWMFDCGKLPGIAFVWQMRLLRDLRICGTNIEDGDLSPCVGIKTVVCDNKRHYSHTEQELKRLAMRGIRGQLP
jgi:protein phosphatase 1 regulatory subunit 7